MKKYHGIGLKSLVALTLFTIGIALAWSKDLLLPERLRNLDPMVPFLVGLVTIWLGRIVFRFVDSERPSKFSLSLHSINKENVDVLSGVTLLATRSLNLSLTPFEPEFHWELNQSLRQISYLIIFICLSLFTINNQALQLFSNSIQSPPPGVAKTCTTEESLTAKAPEKQGCELMIRAHKLGYVKDLGSCEPDTEDKDLEICRLRHDDEPYLHYAFRKIQTVLGHIQDGLSLTSRTNLVNKFRSQWNHLGALQQHQMAAVKSTPQSFHHIWTNLPHPKGWWGEHMQDIFSPNHCLDRYSRLPHMLDWKSSSLTGPSEVLDHVTGHLLFSPRYKSTVAYCREVKIHWNSPKSACLDLKLDPLQFLSDQGALEQTLRVIHRHENQHRLWSWTESLSKDFLSKTKVDKIKVASKSIEQAKRKSAKRSQKAQIQPQTATARTRPSTESTSNSANSKKNTSWALQERYAKPPPLKKVISFQCLMHHKSTNRKALTPSGAAPMVAPIVAPIDAPKSAQNKVVAPAPNDAKSVRHSQLKGSQSQGYSFKIKGHKFKARETFVTRSSSGSAYIIETYKDLSKLLAPGFRYSGFVSREKISPKNSQSAPEDRLYKGRYQLSRLEELRNTDLFLGHPWLHNRPELLAIYPYYYHLYHFVDLFRKDYQNQRGRM